MVAAGTVLVGAGTRIQTIDNDHIALERLEGRVTAVERGLAAGQVADQKFASHIEDEERAESKLREDDRRQMTILFNFKDSITEKVARNDMLADLIVAWITRQPLPEDPAGRRKLPPTR